VSYCSKRSTLNAERPTHNSEDVYGNLGEAGTREALCVTSISELDVERWAFAGSVSISITSMSTRLRQGFGVAIEQKQR